MALRKALLLDEMLDMKITKLLKKFALLPTE